MDWDFAVIAAVLIGLTVAGIALMVWVGVPAREPEYVPLDELASDPAKWLGERITTNGTLKWVDPATAEDMFIIFIPICAGETVVIVPVPITQEYHVYTLVSPSNATVLVASKDSLDAYLDQHMKVTGTIERMDVRKDGRVGRGYFIRVEEAEPL